MQFTAGCCWFPLRPSNSRPVVAAFYCRKEFSGLRFASHRSSSSSSFLILFEGHCTPEIASVAFCSSGKDGAFFLLLLFSSFLEVIAHRRHLLISVLYARAHTTHIHYATHIRKRILMPPLLLMMSSDA